METKAGVYSLTSRATSKVYIGSSLNTRKRWHSHMNLLRRGTHPNHHIQAHVKKYGLDDLVFEVMEVEPDRTLRLGLEQLLITALYGPNCFNQGRDANAPMTGLTHTPETRAKLSLSHMGQKPSPENLAKRAATRIANPMSAEARFKMSSAHKGRKRSPESIAKSSAAHKGRVASPEARAKMSAAKMGKKPSPETKAKRAATLQAHPVSFDTKEKLRLAHLGKRKSLEHRAKVSAAKMGHTVSPETRAKISAKGKGRMRSPEAIQKFKATMKKKGAFNP